MVAIGFRSWWAAVPLCAALGGCGGGGGTTPTPVASSTPVPCTQTVLGQAQGSLPGQLVGIIPFTTAVAGRVDVTVDWTLADSLIGVYITQVAIGCDIQQLTAQACNFLVESPPSTVKPRKVSIPAPVGIYQLLIANFSSNDEAVTAQIVLSLGPCAPFGGSTQTLSKGSDLGLLLAPSGELH